MVSEAIDIIEQALREGEDYTVKQLANRVGISTKLAGSCLRSLERGGICTREKKVVGQTKRGTDKKVFHYRTKQRDLIIEGGVNTYAGALFKNPVHVLRGNAVTQQAV